MSSKDKNLSEVNGDVPSASGLSFGVVVSDWNQEITYKLADACLDTLSEHGVDLSNITKIHVPGTFELPVAAKILLQNKNYDAIICIGCVIRGETKHDEYINHAVASAIANLGILSGKPIIFGVLTPNSMEQALDRAGGSYGNKGVEAAITAIKMATLKSQMKTPAKKIGF